ncbi:MAG: hypothetical protein Q7U71_02470 [bacterium]|nr:hypothetical protein [bacterium]
MRKLMLSFALLSLVAGMAAAQPGEQSLITAWEQSIKNDPATVAFEKTGDRSYKYQTKKFPYKGGLRVVNATIDDYGTDYYNDGYDEACKVGYVETEIDSNSASFMERYARSYGAWQASNTLYFDQKQNQWLNYNQYRQSLTKKYGKTCKSPWLAILGNFWVIFFVILIVFIILLSRRTNKQMKQALARQDHALAETDRALKLSEQSVKLNEESNRLLKEILEALKNKDQAK